MFAPKPRDFSQKINKKMKDVAFRSAISSKVTDDQLKVVDELKIDGKTKEMVAFQKALNLNKRTLVFMDEADRDVVLAARNIPGLATMSIDEINTYALVANAIIVLTKGCVEKLEEAYAL